MLYLIFVILFAGTLGIPAESHEMDEDSSENEVISVSNEMSDEIERFPNRPYDFNDSRNQERKIPQKSLYSNPKLLKNIKTLDGIKPVYLTKNMHYPYFTAPLNNIILKPKKFTEKNENAPENESVEESSANNRNQKKIILSKCNFDKTSPKCNFVTKVINIPLKSPDRVKIASDKQKNINDDSAKNKRTLNIGTEINEKITPFKEEMHLPAVVQDLNRLVNIFDSLSEPQFNSFEKISEQKFYKPVKIKPNENMNERSDTVEKDYVPKMKKSEQLNRVSKSKEQSIKINVLSNQEKVNVQVDNSTEKLKEKIFNKNDNFYDFMQTFSSNVFKTALEYVNKIKNI